MAGHDMTPGILVIEGGGTKRTCALLTREGKVLAQGTAGPGNTLLLNDAGLEKLLRSIRRETGPQVSAIGGAFAGCQREAEQVRIEKFLRKVWPQARRVRAMEDARSLLVSA